MNKRLLFISTALILLLLGGLVLNLPGTTVAQDFGVGPWSAQYFNSTNFTNPAGTATYTTLNLLAPDLPRDGAGNPITGVGADNFSVRFTSSQNFQAGTYLFTLTADDYGRATIDGVEVFPLNQSIPPNTPRQVFVVLTAGVHTMVVEVIEFTLTASVQFQWGLQGAVGTTPGVQPTFGPTVTFGPTPTPLPTALPAIPPGALTATVIRANVLNIRDVPSTGGNRIWRVRRRETYAVVGRDERARWFLLELGGFQGWAYGYYLGFNGNEFNAPVISGNALVNLAGFPDTGVRMQTEAGLRLRAAPSTDSTQIGRITWGAFLPVVGRSADGLWYQTVWLGTVGWVSAPFVEIREGDLNTVPIR